MEQATTYISNPIDMVKPGWKAVKVNIGTLFALLGVLLLPALLTTVGAAIAVLLKMTMVGVLVGVVGVIALLVLMLIAAPTYNIILLESVRGQQITLREAMRRGRSLAFRMFGLAMLVVLAVMGGLVLFIIPGLVFIAWFSLSSYVMIAENLGIVDSMKRSKQLVSGRVWEMWGLSMLAAAGAAIPIVGSILNIILSITLMPALAIRYHQLSTTQPADRPAVHWANYIVIVVAIVLGGLTSKRTVNEFQNIPKEVNSSTYSY